MNPTPRHLLAVLPLLALAASVPGIDAPPVPHVRPPAPPGPRYDVQRPHEATRAEMDAEAKRARRRARNLRLVAA